ncbi:hypothetical protein WAI87_21270, partial [Acinetobacter baumannii]
QERSIPAQCGKYSQRVNWNAILRGATKKKRKSGICLPRAVVYFDLQRLFYRFSCSKITQILTLEYEVVAMSVSKKPMVLVILDGYGYRE